MKIFITGSTGLLGSALLRIAPSRYKLAASFNKNTLVPNIKCKYYYMNITNKKLVSDVIARFSPDVLIHTAAIATPDYCDKHKDEAKEVNIDGTRNIIDACKKNNVSLVYITTNGVYDGKNPPYDEKATPKPIDYYGKTKYESERLVQASGLKFIICRLITMYGWNNPNERQNPLTWELEILGKNKTPINMVDDMYNNFLSAQSASEAIWQTIKSEKFGETFNIAGKDCISRYAFSKEIAKVFDLDEGMIYPVKLKFFKNFVQRPANTCFITKKMEKLLQIKPIPSKKGLETLKNNPPSDKDWKQII